MVVVCAMVANSTIAELHKWLTGQHPTHSVEYIITFFCLTEICFIFVLNLRFLRSRVY